MAKRIISDGIQLPDGNVYDIEPPVPTKDYRGGITLDEKSKYDDYEERILALENEIYLLRQQITNSI